TEGPCRPTSRLWPQSELKSVHSRHWSAAVPWGLEKSQRLKHYYDERVSQKRQDKMEEAPAPAEVERKGRAPRPRVARAARAFFKDQFKEEAKEAVREINFLAGADKRHKTVTEWLNEKWGALTQDERVPYEDQAAEDRQRGGV